MDSLIMSGGIASFVDTSASRIQEARALADEMRHDEKLHRLAMRAVFMLEDCHETFVRLRDENRAAARR